MTYIEEMLHSIATNYIAEPDEPPVEAGEAIAKVIHDHVEVTARSSRRPNEMFWKIERLCRCQFGKDKGSLDYDHKAHLLEVLTVLAEKREKVALEYGSWRSTPTA